MRTGARAGPPAVAGAARPLRDVERPEPAKTRLRRTRRAFSRAKGRSPLS